jgi:type IV pilus assembly protein PilA
MGMVFCRGCGASIHESAPTCPHCGAPQAAVTALNRPIKSQTVAALLCAFLGGIGVHRFYLGNIVLGIFYVLFCWTGIPGLIAFVEIFVILFTSRETWARKYNDGVLSDGPNAALVVVVLIIPVIFMIGILAAIAIPAYQDYTVRARVTEGLSLGSTYKTLVAQNAADGAADLSQGYTPPQSTRNVASVGVAPADGTITVEMNQNAKHVVFQLIPYYASTRTKLAAGQRAREAVSWMCRVSDAKQDRYVPTDCRI